MSQVMLPDGSMAWLVARYTDVRYVLADQRFRRTEATLPAALPQESLVSKDESEHARLRRPVALYFSDRRVAAMRPAIEQTIRQLLDDIDPTSATFDLIETLAVPLPLTIICDLLGVPHDARARFRDWSHHLLSLTMSGADVDMDAIRDWFMYLIELFEEKRRQPQQDLISELVDPNIDEPLSELELVVMVITLFVPGYETTANAIGLSALSLLRQPEQYAALCADQSLISGAVEELLRVNPPSDVTLPRLTTSDIELAGTIIPAGSLVLPSVGSANRDERVFSNPDQLDITRADNRHLTFGGGIHRCIGANLARLELQITLESLVTRFPNLRLAIPAHQVELIRTGFPTGVADLPVAAS